MLKWLLAWAINAGVLLLLPYILPAVQVKDFTSALIAALVLGLLNAIVRPILMVLTLPITVITLGLFLLVINGLMFWLVELWLGHCRSHRLQPHHLGSECRLAAQGRLKHRHGAASLRDATHGAPPTTGR